ncbi:helical backbone metal receptor [Micromonospora parathelypteridis]|uniref:ABC-type Fe3+-hydroxamate transport system substrate-binding protein n=1 Tax=Micromonospora parathelypteridis TaxID=1839617 RepID=A0A840VYL5_9ACTN|nr:helical backbone metal receptor [Micromonospora parathelypteridis]MBB5481747.1 ABC-type Fe3+-hydroxamate transport system substrate-binding protein [Micromonospora parathelypteridis]GGO28369.1 ABC transporter substrate-binding protein [Micromonospora parathelypteridis]
MRVVSLVPSLTEAVAMTLPGVLVGATDWCSHPVGLDVARVGGSKYPDLDRVRALRPDLVLLNVEENRRADADALRAAGVPVRVTYPRTVPGALTELGELLAELGASAEPAWLRAARRAWAEPPRLAPPRRAVVPVWRRPWVVLGGDTFAGDVLRRLGVVNSYDEHPDRYPRPTLAELREREPELVVLPDEPYTFTADDGPEAFPGVPCALLSGRHLTWYGPSLAEAPAVLADQLSRPVLVG